MSNIVSHLQTEILHCISTAKEINIAVALINACGVDILSRASKKTTVKIVTGVDLPTPIDVLKSLRESYGTNARLYLQKDYFYHPKVYLFTLKDDYCIAYIGSGNFTSGGLESNIELSYKVKDQEECRELKSWFDNIFNQSSEITDSFLKEYRPYVTKWQHTKKEQSDDMQDIQDKLNTIHANIKKIKKELLRLRASADYTDIVNERKEDVKSIRKAIDYKNGFKYFNVRDFLKIAPLGNIRKSYTKQMEKAVKDGSMQKLCLMLCDDKLPIEERYHLAVTEYKVDGCGCNVLTKILCVHRPKQFMLWNKVSKDFLDYTQVSFERGTKEWSQYKQLCQMFNQLCVETDIDNFAVLDELLYRAMAEIYS